MINSKKIPLKLCGTLLVITLSACGSNPLYHSDLVSDIDHLTRPYSQNYSVEMEPYARQGGGSQVVYLPAQRTDVVYLEEEVSPDVVRKGINPAGQDYTLNLQQVDVRTAAETLFTEIIKAPYSIDPDVSGKITMASGGPIKRSDLLMVFESALKASGMKLSKGGSGFRIGAFTDISQVTAITEEGFGITAVPLRRVGAKRMLTLLDGFAAPEGTVRASENDDIILIKGTAAERENILTIIRAVDVEILSKPSSGLAFLKNADAALVSVDLSNVAKNKAGDASWETQVLRRSNAILVQAASQRDLQIAMGWIERLDRGGSRSGGDIAVYKAQYSAASDLSATLQATFGDIVTENPQLDDELAERNDAEMPGDVEVSNAMPRDDQNEMSFVPNDSNNTIVIRAPTPIRQKAIQLLEVIDRPPVQVMIDMLLVEVTLNEATAWGVQAYLQSSDLSLLASNGQSSQITGSTPGSNLLLGNRADPKLIIDQLSQVTRVKVLSAPSVFAFESEEAVIKVVEQVPIVTQQVVSTETNGAPIVNSVEYRDAGVILKVTPRVNEENLVDLKVDQELSAVVNTGRAGADLTPTLRQRSISTRVAVQDNETIALGGLISSQVSRGRTRLFGFLPNRSSDSIGRTELIIFITPHVVRSSNQADSIALTYKSRLPKEGEQ